MHTPKRSLKRTVKSTLRNALVLVAVILTAPLWVAVRIVGRVIPNDNLFLACSEFLSLFPGLPGIFLRRGYYVMTVESFSRDCTIEFGTWIAHRRVRIGHAVYIGGRCTLGSCSIGDYTLLGSNVDLIAGRHTHRFDDPTTPISLQGGEIEPVRIGRNCWIGNSAVIMCDVGDDTVVGAGSVVAKPLPAGVIAVGNPCVVKRRRFAESHKVPEEKGADCVGR
jgi:virginiamycin A acetyltransferase